MPLEQQQQDPPPPPATLSLSPHSAPPSQDQERRCLLVLAAVVKGLPVCTLFGIESASVESQYSSVRLGYNVRKSTDF